MTLTLNESKFFLQTFTLTPSMHGKLTEHGKYFLQSKEALTESSIKLKENVKSFASFGNQLANKKRPFLETPKVLWNRTVISDIKSVDMLVVLQGVLLSCYIDCFIFVDFPVTFLNSVARIKHQLATDHLDTFYVKRFLVAFDTGGECRAISMILFQKVEFLPSEL